MYNKTLALATTMQNITAPTQTKQSTTTENFTYSNNTVAYGRRVDRFAHSDFKIPRPVNNGSFNNGKKALANYTSRPDKSQAKCLPNKGKAYRMVPDRQAIREAEAAGHRVHVTRSGNITVETRRQQKTERRAERRAESRPEQKRSGRNSKSGNKNLLGKDFALNSQKKAQTRQRPEQPEQDAHYRGKRQTQKSGTYSRSVVTNMGQIPVGQARTVVNTVCNSGDGQIIKPHIYLVPGGTEAGDWRFDKQISSLHHGQCEGYELTLAPTSPGIKSKQLEIRVGDDMERFNIIGTAVEAGSAPPSVQHIATMDLSEPYAFMSFSGDDELVVVNREGSDGKHYQVGPSFSGRQQQSVKFEPALNILSLLCPGTEGKLVESGPAPSLDLRQQGEIVRQVPSQALKTPEEGINEDEKQQLRQQKRLRLHDADCPKIEGKVTGLLQVKNPDGEWGGVCLTGFTNQEAEKACESLGYPAADARLIHDCQKDKSTASSVATNIRCTGNERTLLDCEQIEYTSSCDLRNVHLACANAHGLPTARLFREGDCVAGSSSNNFLQGIFQVWDTKTDSWMSVCSHEFEDNEVKVASRMLGVFFAECESISFYHTDDYFHFDSITSRPQCEALDLNVAFEDIDCQGSESSLYDCPNQLSQSCRDYDWRNPLSILKCKREGSRGCSDGATDTLHLQRQGVYSHNWQTGETKRIQSLDTELRNVREYHSPDTHTILTSNGSFVNLLSRNNTEGIFSHASHSLPVALHSMRGRPGSQSVFGLTTTTTSAPELVEISINTTEISLSTVNFGRLNLSWPSPNQLAVSGNGLVAVGDGKHVTLLAVESSDWQGIGTPPPLPKTTRKDGNWKVPLISVGAVVLGAGTTLVALAGLNARKLRQTDQNSSTLKLFKEGMVKTFKDPCYLCRPAEEEDTYQQVAYRVSQDSCQALQSSPTPASRATNKNEYLLATNARTEAFPPDSDPAVSHCLIDLSPDRPLPALPGSGQSSPTPASGATDKNEYLVATNVRTEAFPPDSDPAVSHCLIDLPPDRPLPALPGSGQSSQMPAPGGIAGENSQGLQQDDVAPSPRVRSVQSLNRRVSFLYKELMKFKK